MLGRFGALLLVLCLAGGGEASAQSRRMLIIKNGETIELHTLYFIVSCRSIMIGLPEIEIVEGPPEVKLSIREEPVVPRRFNCAKPVPGGTLLATVHDITASKHAELVYRVKYKSKEGERQTAHAYELSLYP